MRRVFLDVRDLDGSWWERVAAYPDAGDLHLPRESVERLGEIDPATGDAWLVDGTVAARATVVTVDGAAVEVWAVGAGQLTARPSRGRGGRGR